jgi:large-conductance mechanosensitive channel
MQLSCFFRDADDLIIGFAVYIIIQTRERERKQERGEVCEKKKKKAHLRQLGKVTAERGVSFWFFVFF